MSCELDPGRKWLGLNRLRHRQRFCGAGTDHDLETGRKRLWIQGLGRARPDNDAGIVLGGQGQGAGGCQRRDWTS
jgi:hypothetical protein